MSTAMRNDGVTDDASRVVDEFFAHGEAWSGDATSVIEFLRPLRAQLDAPGVLEVCVNQPGEILVETLRGWTIVPAPDLTLERCRSLATAVATYSDQQINQERPLLSATLPSGERVQFVIPPAVTRGTVSITVRKPSHMIKRLDITDVHLALTVGQNVVLTDSLVLITFTYFSRRPERKHIGAQRARHIIHDVAIVEIEILPVRDDRRANVHVSP